MSKLRVVIWGVVAVAAGAAGGLWLAARAPSFTPLDCPFSKIDLDLSVSAAAPLDSPFNRAVRAVREGRPVNIAELGHSPQFILAYAETLSVAVGAPVTLRYARGVWGQGSELRRITVVDGLTNEIVRRVELPKGEHSLQHEPCVAYYNGGCAFSRSIELSTTELTVGAYYAFLSDDRDADSHPVFFNVRPPVGSTEVLVVYPTFTWFAYNLFGGGSLYYHQELVEGRVQLKMWSRDTRLYAASLRRPLLVDPRGVRDGWSQADATRHHGLPEAERYDVSVNLERVLWSSGDEPQHVVAARQGPGMTSYMHSPASVLAAYRELRKLGYRVAAVSQTDLNEIEGVLEGVSVVVFVGHHEYWTAKEAELLERFVRDGGSLANFAGNVHWGRVNLDESYTLYLDQLGGRRVPACSSHIPPAFAGTGYLGIHVRPGGERLLGLISPSTQSAQ